MSIGNKISHLETSVAGLVGAGIELDEKQSKYVVHHDLLHLDITTFKEYFDAIISDDVIAALAILDAAKGKDLALLLAGHFDYGDDCLLCHLPGKCFRVQLPLALACAASSTKVLRALLERGTSTSQQDCCGNTVAHSLITHVHYNPDQEDRLVEHFRLLLSLLSVTECRKMLHTENKYGLRAIEFAAQHGSCDFFQAIMDTEGVYLYKKEIRGPTQYMWYDITDYEGVHQGNRSETSPLLFFTFGDYKWVVGTKMDTLLHTTYMHQWTHNKFNTNLPLILLLFVIRFLYIAAFFVVDGDTTWYIERHAFSPENSTYCRPSYAITLDPTTSRILCIYLIIHSVIVIAVDIYETFRIFSTRQWAVWYTVSGQKNVAVQVLLYRYVNLSFSIFVLVYSFISLFNNGSDVPFIDIARVVCPTLAVWNILYFIQLVPSIGHFVVTIQMMLKDLLHFFLIYILMIIPFTHSFQVVVNSNSRSGCHEEFAYTFEVFYSLFRIMLNLLDVTTLEIENPQILQVAHIAYTFLISIMMINFFIALMSNSVSAVSAYQRSALCTQRRSVAHTLEARCSRFLKRYYGHMRRKHYITEGDKILLVETRSVLAQ